MRAGHDQRQAAVCDIDGYPELKIQPFGPPASEHGDLHDQTAGHDTLYVTRAAAILDDALGPDPRSVDRSYLAQTYWPLHRAG